MRGFKCLDMMWMCDYNQSQLIYNSVCWLENVIKSKTLQQAANNGALILQFYSDKLQHHTI